MIAFNNKKLCQQSGFTLIEVMVALIIFMVIALGLTAGEISALSTHRGNTIRDEALRLAQDELDRLKSERFTINGTSAALTQTAWVANQPITVPMRNSTIAFQRTFQITDIAATQTALKRVDVAVGWTMGANPAAINPTNQNSQVSISTLLTRSN